MIVIIFYLGMLLIWYRVSFLKNKLSKVPVKLISLPVKLHIKSKLCSVRAKIISYLTCEGMFLLVIVQWQTPDEGFVCLTFVCVIMQMRVRWVHHGVSGWQQHLVRYHLLVRILRCCLLNYGEPGVVTREQAEKSVWIGRGSKLEQVVFQTKTIMLRYNKTLNSRKYSFDFSGIRKIILNCWCFGTKEWNFEIFLCFGILLDFDSGYYLIKM